MASQVPGVSSSYPPHTTLHQQGTAPNPTHQAHALHQPGLASNTGQHVHALPLHQPGPASNTAQQVHTLHQQSTTSSTGQQVHTLHQQGTVSNPAQQVHTTLHQQATPSSTGQQQGQQALQTSSIFFDSEIKKGSEIVISQSSQHGLTKLMPDIKQEVLVDQQQDVYMHEGKQVSPELEVSMYATSAEITSTAADSIYTEISQASQVAVCSSTSMINVNQPHSSGMLPEGGMPKPSQSDKSHMCLTCGKAFRNKPQLTQHELVHNGIRKHVCSYCDKAFKQICHLNQHIRVHTGERPYKCTMEGCGRSFAQLSNLNHHQKNHEEHVRRDVARHFRCEVCDRSYANQNSLQTHIMKLHAGVKEVNLALQALASPPPKKKKKTVVKTEDPQISYSTSADPGDTYLVNFAEAEEDGLPSQVRTKSSLSPKMAIMTPVPLESNPQSSAAVRTPATAAPMSVPYQNSPVHTALSEHYQNSPQHEGQGHVEVSASQSSVSDRGAAVEVVSSSTYSQATRNKLAQYQQQQQQHLQQQQQKQQQQQQQQQQQHQSFGLPPREATPNNGLSQREATPSGISDLPSIQIIQQHHARLLQQQQQVGQGHSQGQGQGHNKGQGQSQGQALNQVHGDRSSPLVSQLPPRSSPLMHQQQQQHQQHQQHQQQQQHHQQQQQQQVAAPVSHHQAVTEAPSRVTHHYPEAGSQGKAGTGAGMVGRPQLFNPAFSDSAGRYTQNQF